MGDYLSEKEVAEILKVSRRVLYVLRVQGEGPPFIQLSPKIVRYDFEEVKKWLSEKSKQKAVAP